MKKQRGFTLVEIAIVMVIIGLLLGGVLKGKEIITNAKIKNLENDFQGITAAIYSYQDRYRALPGDDKGAKRFAATLTAGDGNGKIKGDFDSSTPGGESRLFWLHLRHAGLIAGELNDSQPTHAFQGLTGASTDSTSSVTDTTIKGLFVGFTDIPGNIAVIIESRTDDGEAKKGNVQSSEADYTEDKGKSQTLHKLIFAL
ncbi:MAG: hypothetical protein BWK79_07110 [Beggiatoa sp. IS2]|nr:MAG: hypothetical protein BWK79_07110 [Beggiatoa sp. IS2]